MGLSSRLLPPQYLQCLRSSSPGMPPTLSHKRSPPSLQHLPQNQHQPRTSRLLRTSGPLPDSFLCRPGQISRSRPIVLYFLIVLVAVSTVIGATSPQYIDSETTRGALRNQTMLWLFSRGRVKDLQKIEGENVLLVRFKIGEDCFEFRKLFWRNTRKGDSKAISIDPPHGRFVNSQRPI